MSGVYTIEAEVEAEALEWCEAARARARTSAQPTMAAVGFGVQSSAEQSRRSGGCKVTDQWKWWWKRQTTAKAEAAEERKRKRGGKEG